MTKRLHGLTVALAEGRQLEELAGLLEKEGATTLRCPLISIHDAPDPAPVHAWLLDLIAGRFDLVIFMTGEAVRSLLTHLDRAALREPALDALRRTRIITRGPKPVRALKEIGLTPTLVAETPTTPGVIATLRREDLSGRTVGVTLYGKPNPELEHFLQQAGATVSTVMAYVYAPAADADRVAGLIGQIAAGRVDAVLFTSSPQVERLYEVAAERGLQDQLRQGLERTRVAAVGPVVAEALRANGARVDVCPEQGFVMKNLVQLVKRDVGRG